jgi:hypothetical protein
MLPKKSLVVGVFNRPDPTPFFETTFRAVNALRSSASCADVKLLILRLSTIGRWSWPD